MATRDLEHWRGLTEAEAARRLAAEGPNQLPDAKGGSWFALLRDVLTEPMFLLLIGASAIYLLLGDPVDALVLACSLVAVVAITVYQERRTDRTLRALRDLSSPRALVIRDGERRRVAGRDVVRGDLVVIREGDRIPADGVLRESVGVAVDESLLTGESVAVTKRAEADAVPLRLPGGDDLPLVYSGTLAVRGHGIAEVLATGARSQMGRIGTRLGELGNERTPLQRQTAHLVRILAIAGLGACVLVTVTLAARGSLLQGALAGITLAMSLLPEEFPVVLTIFLALGAWRISKQRVLTRRAPVIEALGAATVLAVDKTGTLTENRMTLRVVESNDACVELGTAAVDAIDPALQRLLATAMRACELDIVDPMDRAIVEAANAHATSAARAVQSMQIVREYDLSAGLLAVVHAWRGPGDTRTHLMAKGAPEAIATLCRLNANERAKLFERALQHAGNGLRVLAVAHALHDGELPDAPTDVVFHLDGLLGLVDPVRPGVPETIAECRTAGIRVVMITGDHPSTALSIARAIGLDVGDGIVTGADLERMDPGSLSDKVRRVNVYARIVPEQKLRLVQALKANGEVVAMTGDGVNDAPALKAAHIGVAMGSRGSDVAREAAGLVLLDDDFAALVATVRAGRRIFENIRGAMTFLVAVHIPLGGMGLVPALAGWPLFLFPVHVVFLEFVIDPACSLVFEAERPDPGLMHRPPRSTSERLFNARFATPAVLLGLAILLAVALVYAHLLDTRGAEVARAAAFATLVIANIVLIATSRSRTHPALVMLFRPNVAFMVIAGCVVAALMVALYWPPAAHLFQFAAPTMHEFAMVVAAGVASVLWYDLVKLAHRRLTRHEPPQESSGLPRDNRQDHRPDARLG